MRPKKELDLDYLFDAVLCLENREECRSLHLQHYFGEEAEVRLEEICG